LKVLAFPGPNHRVPVDAEEAAPPDEPSSTVLGGDAPPPQYDRITIRAITVALVLSLFVHLAVLLLPAFNRADRELKAPGEAGPLQVSIASNPPPAPQLKPEPPKPTPTPTPQVSRTKPQPQSRPQPQIAINGTRPPFVVPPPTTIQPPTPQTEQPKPVVPTDEDFTEVLAARQQARRNANGGAPDEVVESDNERANRIAKANVLAQQRSSSPGQDPDQSGGIFDMKHTGITDAEFVFNGWNRDFRRKLGQTIEVRVPPGGDIRLAVVRRMIDIIRSQKPGDFEWYNYRTGKSTVMSARPKDQPELELFLIKEFYAEDQRAHAH
jgi:hypothetical protein